MATVEALDRVAALPRRGAGCSANLGVIEVGAAGALQQISPSVAMLRICGEAPATIARVSIG